MRQVFGIAFVGLLVSVAFADGTLSMTPNGPSVSPVGGIARDVALPFAVAGYKSWDAVSDASNDVVIYDAAAAAGLPSGTSVYMTGIGWDVTITAISPSWLSELGVYFDDNVAPDLSGLFLRPGTSDTNPGTASFTSSGIIDLSDNSIPDILLPNGLLRLEFYESFDDTSNAIDGTWDAGVLNIQVTPEPTSAFLLALGLLAVRRR